MNENELKAKQDEIISLLCKRRTELKITQIEVCRRSGLSLVTVKRMENIRIKQWLNVKSLLRYCSALHLEVNINIKPTK